MRVELARVGIDSIQHVESRYLGDKHLLLPLVQASGVPANSDYFPFVDLNAPRARILRQNAAQLTRLSTLPLPFFELLTGAEQRRERTVFSPNSSSSRDKLVGQATALRDAWETAKYDSLSPSAARTFLTLYSPKEECSKPGVRRAWLDSAYYIASNTNVALASNELRVIWDRLAATPCAQQLSKQDRDMFALLQAVALRDVERVAEIGAALYAAGYDFQDGSLQSLALIATAASQLAVNKPREASALIGQNADSTPQTAAQALALHWLSALAVADINGDSAREAVAKSD
jgi:hypothetical protein